MPVNVALIALPWNLHPQQDLHGDSEKAEGLFLQALEMNFWNVEALSAYALFLHESRG